MNIPFACSFSLPLLCLFVPANIFHDGIVTLQEVDLDETLVVVTADHSHVMTINGYPDRGHDILGKSCLKCKRKPKCLKGGLCVLAVKVELNDGLIM